MGLAVAAAFGCSGSRNPYLPQGAGGSGGGDGAGGLPAKNPCAGISCSRTMWTDGGPPVREVRCTASFSGDKYQCDCLVADVSIGVCLLSAEEIPSSDNPCNACDPDINCCNALFDGDGG